MKSKKLIFFKKLEKRVNKVLHNKYKILFNKKYEVQIIENVMCNDVCHFVAVFKDYLIADDVSEYLRRVYKKEESIQRLIKLFAYYQETSVIFPNYTPLVESKYLYNNVIRKQRVIDEQQNLEEYKKYLINKEKKKNEKKSPLKAIENFFSEDTYEDNDTRVFNSKAYDEILNTAGSVKRIVFGIENNNTKNNEKNNVKDSVKELLMKIDKYDGIKTKNKDNEFFKDVKKNLKYAAKLLAKNNNNDKKECKSKSKSKDKNNIIENIVKKDNSSSFKKNRTININININNTKNNFAMTDRPFIPNNNSNNYPLTTKGKIKEKRFIFNQKKMNSAFPNQLFRSSNIISNLIKKNKNNNINSNSINDGLQQKLIQIFSKKVKNKKNKRNNSYNLSLSKTSNTNRLRTKNKAFIISTIQNTLLHSKSKRNHSINIKSDKNIYISKKKEKNNSTLKNNKNCENNNLPVHKRKKSQVINIYNINNIDNELFFQTKKNLNTNYNNKHLLTISNSLKTRNIFGFKTMSKLTAKIHEYKSKKIYNRNNEAYLSYNKHNSKNNSLKNKKNIKKQIVEINEKKCSYKSHKSCKNPHIYKNN